MQAFILVQTEVGRSSLVSRTLHDIEGVESAEAVLGPYDVVVRISGENDGALADIVGRIQRVDAITRTLTCPIADAHADARSPHGTPSR